MVTISLCMIVKNEEKTLPRCLDSVGDLAEEIVVVDTGSTDATVETARRYTEKVYHFFWRDDFAAARNFAFDQAAMEYCLWLDADDVLELPDRAAFQKLKETLPPSADVVMLPYHTAFDEEGRPAFTYYRERLIRRAAGLRWTGAVHEAIAPAGRVLYGEAAVTHRKTGPGDPDRNLRILEGLLERNGTLSPRERFYYGRELMAHGRDEEAAAVLTAFLNAGEGWVENQIQACLDLAGCWERLGRPEEAFACLTRSLRFGPPRAEVCCELGRFFLERAAYPAAVYWFEQAMECPRDDRSGSFSVPDCRTYIPCLQLCVLWYRLGDTAKAESYNRRAEAAKPNSAACRYNRAFFAAKAGETQEER